MLTRPFGVSARTSSRALTAMFATVGVLALVATLVGGLREAGVRVVVAAAQGSTIACDELVTTVEPAFGLLGRPYTELVGRVHAHAALVAAHLRDRNGADAVDLVHTHTEVVGPAVLAALILLWREWIGSEPGPLNPVKGEV